MARDATVGEHARPQGRPLARGDLQLDGAVGERQQVAHPQLLDEVRETMRDLRRAGVDVLVLGQYLRPTRESAPVARWVAPGEFDALREEGLAMGFAAIVATPRARTSYHARDAATEAEDRPGCGT